MDDLKACPWCRKANRLAFSFHQAAAKRTRYGAYDGAIYCRRCGAYGPTIKSEWITTRLDWRNETPTGSLRDAVQKAAIRAWNAAENTDQITIENTQGG